MSGFLCRKPSKVPLKETTKTLSPPKEPLRKGFLIGFWKDSSKGSYKSPVSDPVSSDMEVLRLLE